MDSTGSSKKYYAVRSGRCAGVFADLESTLKQVLKFHNAEFATFDNIQDADRYLAEYAKLYEMNPPLATDLAVIQVYAESVVIKETLQKLVGVSCYGHNFTAVSHDSTAEQVQLASILQVLKTIKDVEHQGILIGCIKSSSKKTEVSNYAVEALDKINKCMEEVKTEDPKELADRPELVQYSLEKTFDTLCEIIDLNSARKFPVVIKSSDNLNNLYVVRVPLSNASSLVQLLANDLNQSV